MTVNNFTPEVWAASILENLNAAHVYANCVNRDYEGDIRAAGDTVRINAVGRVTISNYTKASTTLTPEQILGAGVPMTISQQKYFFFALDDVDKAQIKGSVMQAALKDAAWGLADAIDNYIAGTVLVVDTANQLTAQVVGTGASDSDAFEVLVDLKTQLEISNTPKPDRWCVIPPWYFGMLLKDPRFTSFGTSGNLAAALSGDLGKTLLGMTVHVSNNVPTSGSAYTVFAGYKGAVTYAESIPQGQPEAFRLQTGFQDAVRGLVVYGGLTTRPSALASIAVTQAT